MWIGQYQGGSTKAWSDASNAHWSNLDDSGSDAYQMPAEDNGTTDAAGLPVAPLIVNADEVIGTGTPSAPKGAVKHPIRFTVNHMLNDYVWPATAHSGVGYCTGGYEDPNRMLLQSDPPTFCSGSGPAGEIYRLKASTPTPACAATSPQAAIIIQGMRHYGIILADNGTTGGLIGTPDSRWNDTDLACLTQLHLSDFEPVDVSSLAVNPLTSYQVGPSYQLYTATQGIGSGTVTGCADRYLAGQNFSCTITPSTLAVLESVTGCGGTLSGNVYSGVMPSGDCTVTTTFGSSGSGIIPILRQILQSPKVDSLFH